MILEQIHAQQEFEEASNTAQKVTQETISRDIGLLWAVVHQHTGKFSPKVLKLVKNGLRMPTSLVSATADIFVLSETSYDSPVYAAGLIMALLGQHHQKDSKKNLNRIKLLTNFMEAEGLESHEKQQLALAATAATLNIRAGSQPFEKEMAQYQAAAQIMDATLIPVEFKAEVGNILFAASPHAVNAVVEEYVNLAPNALLKALMFDSSTLAEFYNPYTNTVDIPSEVEIYPITMAANSLVDAAKPKEFYLTEDAL